MAKTWEWARVSNSGNIEGNRGNVYGCRTEISLPAAPKSNLSGSKSELIADRHVEKVGSVTSHWSIEIEKVSMEL